MPAVAWCAASTWDGRIGWWAWSTTVSNTSPVPMTTPQTSNVSNSSHTVAGRSSGSVPDTCDCSEPRSSTASRRHWYWPAPRRETTVVDGIRRRSAHLPSSRRGLEGRQPLLLELDVEGCLRPGQVEPLQRLDQKLGDREAGIPLVVAGNDVPRRVVGRRPVQHRLVGL